MAITSSFESIVITNVTEYLSCVWMELTLAIFAALSYFVLSRRAATSKASRKLLSMHSPKEGLQDSDPEPTLAQMATKALRQGNIKDAVAFVRQLAGTQAGRVPANIAFRVLAAIARTAKFEDALAEVLVLKGKIHSGPLEAATADALKCGNLGACYRLDQAATALSIAKSQQTFQTLATAYATDAAAMRQLVHEAPTPFSKAFAELVLGAQAVVNDPTLAAEVLDKLNHVDAAALKRRSSSQSLASRSTSASADGSEKGSSNRSSPRNSSEGDSALRTDSLLETCKAAAAANPKIPQEIAMRANDIRSCGRNGDLAGALKVFERLDQQKAETTLVINSIMDACLACKDLQKAFDYFSQAKSKQLADVVSYNTMIKGYLANGQESVARQILSELSQTEMTATRPSYHGLLNARVMAGDLRGAWKLIADMQLADLSPNAITCAILLKAKSPSLSEVSKVLALIDAMQEPMDEVLFLSVVDACIRTKNTDKLARQMDRFMRQGNAAGLSAPTYGMMIKAFGQARDIDKVWSLWKQMNGCKVVPTSVTLGCMVEALVANGYTSDAWQLVCKLQAEQSTRPLVNTIIYSSILKGFASARETAKVMTVYQEMKSQKISPNRITYNTIMNAFAQSGQMQRVPALLDDMTNAEPAVKPDIVTYSTMVKGFCNSGNVDQALRVVKDMKVKGGCTPDEVIYNSLLGGCAKEHRCDDALQLLQDMRECGIAPSNYTLSMLVKLMGRARRINQAFTILEDISNEHNLQINIQVYTCLIQGCFNCGQAGRALEVHKKIIAEGVSPDAMTYSVLIRGCLQAGMVDKAADLARCACGCGPMEKCRGDPPGLPAGCLDEVVAALGGPGDENARKLTKELEDFQKKVSQKHGGADRKW